MRVSGGQSDAQPEPLKPAVSVKKSITPDYIVCLEDGKKFKSLKRHLRTQYNMTPGAIPRQMGPAAGLPDGGAELCGGALAARQADGPRPAAPAAREVARSGGTARAAARARARASALMRSTIERKPFERCGVRCSRRPSRSNSATASVDEDLARRLARIEREQDRDQPAHDVRVAVADEARASDRPRRRLHFAWRARPGWRSPAPCWLRCAPPRAAAQACGRARSHSGSDRPSRRGRRNSR